MTILQFPHQPPGIAADPREPVLAPLDPPSGPVKSCAEIEADFIAAGKMVPQMVKLFAEAERTARLRAVWRVFTGQVGKHL